MTSRPGLFVISLDLELMWGVRDHHTIASYGDAVLGGRTAIAGILELFRTYEIRATWAAVGLLFFDSRARMLKGLPDILPAYEDARLSPYHDLEAVGRDERSDPYHFGRSLIDKIADTPGQEIGTHTFSHYYCLEPGQTAAAFRADLQAAKEVAQTCGIGLKSIVFPRNQWTTESVDICRQEGLVNFRGNPRATIYRPTEQAGNRTHARALRLLDSLVPTGIRTSHALGPVDDAAHDIRASRFLRPSVPRAPGVDRLRSRRILSEMEEAARSGTLYHLWWHPHNFGRNTRRNLADLEEILRHFRDLSARYGMQAANMADVGDRGLSA